MSDFSNNFWSHEHSSDDNSCDPINSPNIEKRTDDPPEKCEGEGTRKPHDVVDSFLKEIPPDQHTGFGFHAQTDPMRSGQIYNDPGSDRSVINKYSRGIRGCDEAMLDLFNNIGVQDLNGKIWKIPIVFGTQDTAVKHVFQDNVKKNETLQIDMVKLPIMSIYWTNIEIDPSRYTFHYALDYLRRARPDGKPGFTTQERSSKRDTIFGVPRGLPINISYKLSAWTLNLEDMNQIIEQIFRKFSLQAYINVQGVQWESIVELVSSRNNLNFQLNPDELRVLKFEFDLLAKTYLPQPLIRKKAVLDIKTDYHNAVEPDEINETYFRERENDPDNQ